VLPFYCLVHTAQFVGKSAMAHQSKAGHAKENWYRQESYGLLSYSVILIDNLINRKNGVKDTMIYF